VNTPPLNSKEPSEDLLVLFGLIIFSPSDFLNMSEV